MKIGKNEENLLKKQKQTNGGYFLKNLIKKS